MLCDTGPIVAIFDANDPYHQVCRATVENMPREVFITTWPCPTEAMYMLHRVGGFLAQNELWKHFESGWVLLYGLGFTQATKMRLLMEKLL